MSTATLPDDLILRERFGDIKPPLAPQAAVIEANRCLNCFDAPCTGACPTHIDVPGFIKRISTGNLTRLSAANPRRKHSGWKLCEGVSSGGALRRGLRNASLQS